MTNRLAQETSPYLLQHKDNPVDWYAWGPEALERAKREDKPILLSIGYSACHWCHVMEHESFEDPETAAYMNEHFVPIKVDREERPDLDSIYMEAVVESWESQRERIRAAAARIREQLGAIGRVEPSKELVSPDILDTATRSLRMMADMRNGGFGSAPKFPPPSGLEFLLARGVNDVVEVT